MTDNELKPCAHCDGEAQLDEKYGYGTKLCSIWCKECGIGIFNVGDIHWQDGEAKQRAITAWNRRVE